jgi:superfamily II DNA helicase RecQ
LKGRGLAVESLLNREDAQRKSNLRARDRLVELGNQNVMSHLILFCTPEIFVNSEYHFQTLVKKRFIKLIVVDEFDIIAEATSSYRSAYIEAIPKIRRLAPTVQLFFLSATFSRKLFAEVITSLDNRDSQECSKRPHLYLSRIPLPPNHVFSGKCFA